MIKDILKGKSLGRILMNKYCQKYLGAISGKTIDFGSGKNPSYIKYLKKDIKLTRTDYNNNKNPDLVIDLNKKIELGDGLFDNAIFLNTVYILENPTSSLKEIYRILKPRGKLFMTFPLVFNEASEPVDYWRWTSQGIDKVLRQAGFEYIKKYKIGERFSCAISLANPFRKLKYLNIIFYPLALFLDKILPNKIKKLHPCPLGYFVICKKYNA
ncbi:MAG: methyltransferase domain-containing protein [Candidatus Pacebacteria bacterium]|nr:methyltransferase domain-containing protein [Candidatus Paceibacterota bacterium]